MIANFTSHFTVCHRRMLSFDPSWGMRTTTTLRWAWSGHLWVTSNTSKAIPARGYISLITSDLALSSERFETVDCIEALIVAARAKSYSSWWKNAIMQMSCFQSGLCRRLKLYKILFLNHFFDLAVCYPLQTIWWYSWQFFLSNFQITACIWMNNFMMDKRSNLYRIARGL